MRQKNTEPLDQVVLQTGPNGNEAIHQVVYGNYSKPVIQNKILLNSFSRRLAECLTCQHPISFGLLPIGLTIRSLYQENGLCIFLVEEAPSVHTVKWLRDDSPAPFGAQSTYQDVTLAFPWRYFFVSFSASGELMLLNSLYFRKQALISLEEPLCDPHLYNCSVNAYGAHSWICTQYYMLNGDSLLTRLDSFVAQFWGSGFNRSSEAHEGASFWTYNHDRIDPRVKTITSWRAATQANPDFVRTMEWIPSGYNAQDVFRELAAQVPKENRLPETTQAYAALFQQGEKP